jgi:glycosyltransferase involved in cell wall biosynthesis
VAKELRKYGMETIMLSPKGEGDFAQRATNEHFKAYQIMLYGPQHFNSSVSILAILRWFLTFPFSVFRIAKIIKKEKIDIVHINGLINLQAPVAAFLTRRKVVWYLSSSLFPKIVVLLLMPFVILISDHIVIIAKKLQEYYFGKRKNLTKVSLIVRSININMFDPRDIPKSDKDKLKIEFNIGSHDKIVGCVGNINPTKGYEYFIQSAGLIKKECNEIKFMIVGAKSNSQKHYHQKLQNLISSLGMEQDIIFTGKRDDIPQMLSIFDVFVLSSVSEGGPAVTLEAMAMKKPVVATDVGGVSEQILGGETGIIVPPRNSKVIAEAVIYLLKHPEERFKMGEKARERVKEMFSFGRCVEEHRKLYKDV